MDSNKKNINSDYIPFILIGIIVIAFVIYFLFANNKLKPKKEEDSGDESDESEEYETEVDEKNKK